MNPHQALKKYFGFKNFRNGQLPIINTILKSQDILAILPTGGGKSICFQIPGLIMPGITLVVSPLISLMKDQVDALTKKNIPATFINSSLTKTETKKRLKKIVHKKYKLVYISPERLQTKKFIEAIKLIQVSLLAIDEAHCISMWGHDFRPPYTQISSFVVQLNPRPTLAAFTATATNSVRKDIVQSLQLKSPHIFLNSFNRDNLRLNVTQCPDSFNQELALFILLKRHRQQPGIIYVSTQKKAEYLAKLVKHYWGNNFPIRAYHAGLDQEQRVEIQDQFLNNQLQIITATTAFGMGVDKSNIRWVIHYQLSASIENYYQEAGRAGRDKKMADCYLLFNQADIEIQKSFILPKDKIKESFLTTHRLKKLQQIINFSQTHSCRQQFILNYFNESFLSCNQCDNCLGISLKLSIHDQQYTQFLQRYLKIFPPQVLNHKIIKLMAIHRPQTKIDFLKIPGIGRDWVEKWYNQMFQVLERIKPYVNDPTTIN